MSKKIIPVLFLLAFLSMHDSHAQFIRNAEKNAPAGWQNMSYEQDGVYGAQIDRAKEMLKGKKPKKTVVVALIGAGIDIQNKDIKDAMWVNRKEKPNGRDDDRNGLVDDIHGWNFLGSPDGATVNWISRAADREFMRLKDKYGEIMYFDGKYYKVDADNNRRMEVGAPVDTDEYHYYRRDVIGDSPAANALAAVNMTRIIRTFMPEFDAELKAKYGDQPIKKAQFLETLVDPNSTDTLRNVSLIMTDLAFNLGYEDWDKVRELMTTKQVDNAVEKYRKTLANLTVGDRDAIGDDQYDLSDRSYGNNNLKSYDAEIGTLQAGIIAGRHNAAESTGGVSQAIRIMPLRIDTDLQGEPYAKDMALAIRYAVDHGADIIQMSKTNTFYPRPWSGWVDEALKYAESKNVLVIMGVMDLSYNLDEIPFYPRRILADGHRLSNFITVAASDAHGNPYGRANFSPNELDLFAPGVDIKTSYLGDTYATGSGSFLAASLVSGVAALIRGYYPQLSPAQIRELLIGTVTSRQGAEVEKAFYLIKDGKAGNLVKDLLLFEELSVAPGIINAHEALRAAQQIN